MTPNSVAVQRVADRRLQPLAPMPSADHELRRAYNIVIESSVVHFWDRRPIHGVNADEALTLYKHAIRKHRDGNALASERWARASRHLARAFLAEAKIAYLEPRAAELPFLEGATAEELELRQHSDTTADLLNSVADHVPPGMDEMPEEMRRYLGRARRHLEMLEDPEYKHELLRAERIKAAYEYGRTLECMALGYEAEAPRGAIPAA